MITLKSFQPLIQAEVNGIGYMFEKYDNLNNAFLIFKRIRHPYLRAVIDSFISEYDGNSWGKNGPILLKKIILKYCNVQNYLDINLYEFKPSAFSMDLSHPCKDLTLFPEKYFYPFTYVRNDLILVFKANSTRNNPELFVKIKDSYAFHFFNKISSKYSVKADDGSFFSAIAARNCPSTFRHVKINNLSF